MLLAHQEGQSIVGGGHVADLDVVGNTGLGDLLRPLHVDVVLGGGGHVNVNVLDAPALLTLDELNAELVSVGLAVHRILGAHLEDEVELLFAADAIGVVDVAVGTGEVGDLTAELVDLLHDAPAHVAVAGHGDTDALDFLAVVLEDFAQIIDSAETGSLGTEDGTAGADSLTGHSTELGSADDAAILAVQITDLAAADTNVTSGAVDVLTDVTMELGHESLAEAHDFAVAAADGGEVGTALGTADGQAGQSILEGLLEAEELDDGKVNVGSETQAALVGAEGRVVLHAVTTVDVILKVIVHPDNTELDGALGLDHALKQAGLLVLGVGVDDRLEGRQDFFDGLQEFGLIRVLGLGFGKNSLNVSVHDK